jgi:hypothetical protein
VYVAVNFENMFHKLRSRQYWASRQIWKGMLDVSWTCRLFFLNSVNLREITSWGGIQVLFVLILYNSAFSRSYFVWHEVMSWLVNMNWKEGCGWNWLWSSLWFFADVCLGSEDSCEIAQSGWPASGQTLNCKPHGSSLNHPNTVFRSPVYYPIYS